MSNMSHCQFRNTLIDLLDCNETINDILTGDKKLEDQSSDELAAMQRMAYLVNELNMAFDELEIEKEEC